MKLVTNFTVLIERRASVGLRRLLAGVATALTLIALLLGGRVAQAATSGWDKVSGDLKSVVSATTTPTLNWAKDISGVRYVKVIVVARNTDPDLVDLRGQVLALGGSVYFNYASVRAINAMLPAARVIDI
ncbi:MAG: hypothetical protein OEU94_11825, partial [Aquincola sp.]|nr:hypothetical protein [Aquincola sp.]